MALYDLAKRVTELVLRRDIAVGQLQNGPQTHNVVKAIHTLEDEPAPGEEGGPARHPSEAEVPHHPTVPAPRVIRLDRRYGKGRRSQDNIRKASRRPPVATPVGADGLKDDERDIAGQVADGASNTEIADSLDMSINTVKMRLTGIFTRLGLTNRKQLADHMHEQEDT